MQFDPNIPIYLQIMNEFKKNIVSSKFPPGSKVTSVRDLAIEYGVNPNTVQRALSELEREGLVYTERTSGRYISEDGTLIYQIKNELANTIIERFIEETKQLGLNKEEIVNLINEKAN